MLIAIGFLTFSLNRAGYSNIDPPPKSPRWLKNLIDETSFIADLNKKEETRFVTDREVFWRYPIKIPTHEFKVAIPEKTTENLEKIAPLTIGKGRAYEHINRGRLKFINRDFESANSTWLSGRHNYGTNYEHHRRNDYFIAMSFLYLTEFDEDEVEIVNGWNNVTNFLSWAFQMKAHIKDDFLDLHTPQQLYNLSAIYYNNKQYSGAYLAAEEGLDFIREKGWRNYRVKLKRIAAEAFVLNRSYLDALRVFDQSLREYDIQPEDAAAILGRIGDIYFDLNNFELAEQVYNWAIQIDQRTGNLNPVNFVLRGESLFWLRKFAESQRMFYAAQNAYTRNTKPIPTPLRAIASIRTADAWLAQVDLHAIQQSKKKYEAAKSKIKTTPRGEGQREKAQVKVKALKKEFDKINHPLKKATLGYYKHVRVFPNDHTSNSAQIRIACLGLPGYGGENINHARRILEVLKITRGARGPEKEFKQKKKKKIKKKIGQKLTKEEMKLLKEQEEAEKKAAEAEAKSKEEKEKEKRKEELKKKKKKPPVIHLLPPPAIHLAWGCQTASFAQHERTPEMVEKVRSFARKYPSSNFITKLIEPVRETQSQKLYEYLDAGDIFSAAIFFEQNRKNLYRSVPKSLASRLFTVYVDVYEPGKAEEFFHSIDQSKLSDLAMIRLATFAAETADKNPGRNVDIADRYKDHKWAISDHESIRLYLDRILGSAHHSPHFQWIYNLSRQWAKKDSKTICDITYPLLSKTWEKEKFNPAEAATIKKKTTETLNKFLNEMIQYETFCGYSLLEFEMDQYKDDPLTLNELYNQRDYLPVNNITGNLFWTLSEALQAKGHPEKAKQIWIRLSQSKEEGVKEVKFAKARLDKRRTELEDLWQ